MSLVPSVLPAARLSSIRKRGRANLLAHCPAAGKADPTLGDVFPGLLDCGRRRSSAHSLYNAGGGGAEGAARSGVRQAHDGHAVGLDLLQQRVVACRDAGAGAGRSLPSRLLLPRPRTPPLRSASVHEFHTVLLTTKISGSAT